MMEQSQPREWLGAAWGAPGLPVMASGEQHLVCILMGLWGSQYPQVWWLPSPLPYLSLTSLIFLGVLRDKGITGLEQGDI